MDPVSRLAYVALIAALFAKVIALVTIQGRGRFRARTFRWPEDAAAFGGTLTAEEDGAVMRAQAALRNDGESQWLFVLGGGAWVLLGARGVVVAAAL